MNDTPRTEEIFANIPMFSEQDREAVRQLERKLAAVTDSLRIAVETDLGRLWAWPSSRETWMERARAALSD